MTELPDPSYSDIASNRLSRGRLAIRVRRVRFLVIRYWWIIALAIMIGLVIQGYRCLHMPVQYISRARMMAGGHLSLPQGEMYSEELANFFGTQQALMRSRQTIVQAMERVSAIHPEVPLDENAKVEATLELRTTIFDLSVTSVNRQYAKLLLDAIMDTYLSGRRGRKMQTTNEAVSAITEEISQLDVEIRNDEQELLNFQKENNVVFIEEQSHSSATDLVGLNNELARLTRERDLLAMENKEMPTTPTQGADAMAEGTNAPPAAGTLNNSLSQDSDNSIVMQQENIDKLKIEREQYSVYLKDKHPKMIELADMIDKEQKFLDVLKTTNLAKRETLRVELDLQIQNLEKQIDESNKKSLDISERLATYEQLKNKITREQGLYNTLASSIQNVDVNKSLDQENIVIMEAASPAIPDNPNLSLQMLLGLGGGILVGGVIIYFVRRLDDRIDSPLEFEENVEFPLIGQIPLVAVDKKSKRVPLLSETDHRHMLLESHRNIRSAILFRSSDVIKPRSLLISSAAPGEGKSTFAANLAIIFAYSGTRVLLIDADLRRGVLHNLFDTPLSPGLSDYLQQQVAWHDAIQKTNLPNLDVIPRGKVPHQAGDLLLGSLSDLLLQESIAEYDIVLWDSAPLLAADDAANLCSRVDGILFIARIWYSSINSVRAALEDLSQRNAKIFGVVLNAVEPNQPGYYDRYKYKEYYTPREEK